MRNFLDYRVQNVPENSSKTSLLAAWWRFKTSEALRSAVIKIPCILNSSKDNFIKPEKLSFVNLKKTKDSFEDSFLICVF